MGRARPLAIDDLMKVIGIRNIGLLQFSSVCDASGHLGFDRLVSLLLHEVSRPWRRPESGAILRYRRFAEKPFAFNY